MPANCVVSVMYSRPIVRKFSITGVVAVCEGVHLVDASHVVRRAMDYGPARGEAQAVAVADVRSREIHTPMALVHVNTTLLCKR